MPRYNARMLRAYAVLALFIICACLVDCKSEGRTSEMVEDSGRSHVFVERKMCYCPVMTYTMPFVPLVVERPVVRLFLRFSGSLKVEPYGMKYAEGIPWPDASIFPQSARGSVTPQDFRQPPHWQKIQSRRTFRHLFTTQFPRPWQE